MFVNNRPYTQGTDIMLSQEDSVKVSMRLYADMAFENHGQQYIEYEYTFHGNSYMIDFDINIKGLDGIVDTRNGYLDFNWLADLRLQEHTVDRYNGSCIYYRYDDDDVDYLSDNADEEENLKSKISWVSFKQRFFNMTMIADKEHFDNAAIKQFHKENPKDPKYQFTTSAVIAIPVHSSADA
ncbi:MAG: hypothetical protein CSB02_01175, partial [Bacteroidia bacterium]